MRTIHAPLFNWIDLQLSKNSPVPEVKNGVFWDVMPCGSGKNIYFGGTERLLLQGDKNR
jgi:hypothetical protein